MNSQLLADIDESRVHDEDIEELDSDLAFKYLEDNVE